MLKKGAKNKRERKKRKRFDLEDDPLKYYEESKKKKSWQLVQMRSRRSRESPIKCRE